MGADDYCLAFCTHSLFWKCWKLSGKTTKFREENSSWTVSGRIRSDERLGIMWLLLSKDTLESPLPREGSFCISFFHGSNGRNEPWHLLVGFICSGSVRVSCVLPQAPFTVNKDRRFQGALFLTYFRCLF